MRHGEDTDGTWWDRHGGTTFKAVYVEYWLLTDVFSTMFAFGQRKEETALLLSVSFVLCTVAYCKTAVRTLEEKTFKVVAGSA